MLSERAMLVNLTIHAWTNRVTDRDATKAVQEKFDLKANGDRYVKHLVDNAALASIYAHLSKIRSVHYYLTMPWLDGGIRILPSTLFMRYQTELSVLKNDLEKLVGKLLEQYDHLKEQAKLEKKALYKPHEYPTADELRRSFGAEIRFMPFPDAQDFRADVGDNDVLEQLKREAATAFANATKQAVDAFHGGLVQKLHKLYTMEMYRELGLDSVRAIVELMPSMNINNDPKLTKVHADLDAALQVSADKLRDDQRARTEFRMKIHQAIKELTT